MILAAEKSCLLCSQRLLETSCDVLLFGSTQMLSVCSSRQPSIGLSESKDLFVCFLGLICTRHFMIDDCRACRADGNQQVGLIGLQILFKINNKSITWIACCRFKLAIQLQVFSMLQHKDFFLRMQRTKQPKEAPTDLPPDMI